MDTLNSTGLLESPRLIASSEVWMEGEAERQLDAVARHPDCHHAVGMPDLHPGPGIPIGASFAFGKTVHPRLVGGDAGCGALVIVLDKVKLPAKLDRRLESAFDEPLVEGDMAEALGAAVFQRGVDGLGEIELTEAARGVAAMLRPLSLPASSQHVPAGFGGALGTIGGGNHFAELGRVRDLPDPEAASALGLTKGSLVVLCHSGSRGLGKALADRWGHEALREEEAAPYLAELAGAIRFARANRLLIGARVLRALGVSRAGKIRGAFDLVHNSVACECVGGAPFWVHRKGCAPARADEPTVVLGSRGTPSWIMCGLGNPLGLSSVAHGAGRKMRRSEARDKLRAKYRRRELSRAKGGGRVLCRDPRLLYEEHPDAYKAIEPVIESLERAELATRVASIEPQVTVKM